MVNGRKKSFEQNRIQKQYIDIAKGIGIILVVLGHCPQVYNPLKQWIYAFHMPLFFIISGMVWCKESHERRGFFTRLFVMDKLKRLIVPCFFWGVVYMLLDAVINRHFSLVNIAYLIYGSQTGFSNAGSLTSLWFFPCMFLTVCLFEIIQQWLKHQEKSSALLFIISIMCVVVGLFLPRISGGYPWSIDVSFLALAFMMWGYLGREMIEKIGEQEVLACLVTVVCFGIVTATFGLNLKNITINNADMAGRYLGDYVLYLLDAIAGSASIILFSRLISSVRVASSIFSDIGKRSIPILIIHKPVLQMINKIGIIMSLQPWLIVIVSTFVGLACGIIASYVVDRFSPALFGEKTNDSIATFRRQN